MKAIVVHTPGPPEVLTIEERPIPTVKPGWVLVKVKAFGLNRSELYTRQGHSGDAATFPRVLGIECVGEVADPSDSDLTSGQRVAALMGSMGREYDGGYAEYALLPISQIIPVDTTLSWAAFGAIPETFITAYGSLEKLDLKPGQTLLIRGGTSSLGMAATTIAADMNVRVIATTRNDTKQQALLENGADTVLIDSGSIEQALKQLVPDGADAVLELVGQPTLKDSVACLKPKGIICQTGLLGDKWDYWVTEMPDAVQTIRRTTYKSEEVTAAVSGDALRTIVKRVEGGRYNMNIDTIFRMEEIVVAHRRMEKNEATGKLVVVND